MYQLVGCWYTFLLMGCQLSTEPVLGLLVSQYNMFFFSLSVVHLTAVQGEALVLECKDSNGPASWTKDGRELKAGWRIAIVKNTIKIKVSNIEDHGLYQCRNNNGQTMAAFFVTIKVSGTTNTTVLTVKVEILARY